MWASETLIQDTTKRKRGTRYTKKYLEAAQRVVKQDKKQTAAAISELVVSDKELDKTTEPAKGLIEKLATIEEIEKLLKKCEDVLDKLGKAPIDNDDFAKSFRREDYMRPGVTEEFEKLDKRNNHVELWEACEKKWLEENPKLNLTKYSVNIQEKQLATTIQRDGLKMMGIELTVVPIADPRDRDALLIPPSGKTLREIWTTLINEDVKEQGKWDSKRQGIIFGQLVKLAMQMPDRRWEIQRSMPWQLLKTMPMNKEELGQFLRIKNATLEEEKEEEKENYFPSQVLTQPYPDSPLPPTPVKTPTI